MTKANCKKYKNSPPPFSFSSSKTGFYSVAQAELELVTFLLQPPKYWNYGKCLHD